MAVEGKTQRGKGHEEASRVMASLRQGQREQHGLAQHQGNNDSVFMSYSLLCTTVSIYINYLPNFQQSYEVGTIIIPHFSVRK